MKKKEFLSKLKFQKTTIVSFDAIKSIKGGTLQGETTQIVSVDGFTCNSTVCPTLIDCYTNDGGQSCISCTGTECTRPTNTDTSGSVHCVGNLPTQRECTKTARC